MVRSCIVFLLVVLGHAALAQTPTFRPNRLVYTQPEGFIPDKLSVRGLQQLQRTAAGLHFPFYVVFVRNLPTASGSSTNEDAERMIIGTAEAWAQHPGFDRNRSSIFLVSYGPGDRKFRLLPAPQWRSEIGLEYNALVPFTDIFRSLARQNPQAAITNMMLAYDAHIWDRVDPKRKAERAAEDRKRQAAEVERQKVMRLENARAELDSATFDLRTALSRDPSLLPPNTEEFRTRLNRAVEARSSGNEQALYSAREDMKLAASAVLSYVQQREAARRAEAIGNAATIGGAILLLLIGIALVVARAKGVAKDRERLTKRLAEWRHWITQARQRYYLFDENRSRAPHLRQFGGKTRELYESTSKEIDSIITGVEAISLRLDTIEKESSGGSFLNRSPLTRALADLDQPFRFDTQQISDKLFEPETKTIEVTPSAFFKDLSTRYDSAIADWQALNGSVTESLQLPDVLFPHSGLDALLAKAAEHRIPERWLAGHPLMGSADQDQSLYAKINECRLSDPYAYALQIEELRSRERDVAADLDRIIAALALAGSKRVESIEGLESTVLHPDDNPQITLDAANVEIGRLSDLLSTAETVEQVEEHAQKTHDLYMKCAEQIATAKAAIATAPSLVQQAIAQVTELQFAAGKLEIRLEEVSREHQNVAGVRGAYEAAQQFKFSGARDLARAQEKLGENKHVSALRDANLALEAFAHASQKLETGMALCVELDALKARYIQKLAEMQDVRDDIVRRIHRYGGSSYMIDEFRTPRVNGLVDYAYLFGMLQETQREWNMVARQAENAYEAAQRAQREAEEAARRAQESSLFSSSSSSSSFGSWSSSDSGSSGGSFSSSSSDSGSSGGSW